MSFISTAFAANAAPAAAGQSGAAGGLSSMIFLAVFFLIFYFLFIRPQQRRAKEQRNLINSLAKGDEVVTSGGLIGKISKISDDYLTVELAEGVEVKVQKQAISTCLPKGTLKTI